MTQKIRVPVLSPEGKPLMPTTSARARKWIANGKAKPVWNDLDIFCVQLFVEPSGTETQEVVIGVDPGKMFSGIAAVTKKAVLFTSHLVLQKKIKKSRSLDTLVNGQSHELSVNEDSLIFNHLLPFKRVIARKQAQKILRRARRGRRINRNLPFANRAHRQKRFENRRGNKLPPSIRANRQLELRIVQELVKLFPVTEIVYEYIKARGNKGLSPVMVGQLWMLEQLSAIAPTHKLEGWKTSNIRKYLGLEKNKDNKRGKVIFGESSSIRLMSPNSKLKGFKTPQKFNSFDKSVQDVTTHAVDGISLAASRFIEYKSFCTANNHGHHWVGSIQLTDAPFKVITRPQLYRRQLHFENPLIGGTRKRKGGTITPFGFRSGDLVQGTKGKLTVKGYIGGYSEPNKVVSIYDVNWKRLGQFRVSKTQLLRRSNGLCVA